MGAHGRARSGRRHHLAVQRGQYDHRRPDARSAVLQRGDQRVGIALRDRFAERVVVRDAACRQSQQTTVAFELPLDGMFGVDAVGERYRAQSGGQHGREQEQKGQRDSCA